MSAVPGAPRDLVRDHVAALRAWLRDHDDVLSPYRERPTASMAAAVEQDRALMALLYESEWGRWGWPAQAGGLGGPVLLRAALYDELAHAGLDVPETYVMMETLAALVVQFSPELAARHLPAFLRGEEIWAQGFSEPDAGSDLAHLRTRAEAVEGGFRLSGQKVWTTLGQFARYAAVLARTGDADSAHRGLTMLWVDLEAPGVSVRPITASNGRDEFAEMFFDDAHVPTSGVIGTVSGGWAAAMYLLQYERGMYAWLRQAVLHRRLRDAARTTPDKVVATNPGAVAALGRSMQTLAMLRARSLTTVTRLSAGENPGPEISVDKALLSQSEQAVFDALRLLDPRAMATSAEPSGELLREEWFYSRATSIFGGAVDVQRDIVAERVLMLPRSRS